MPRPAMLVATVTAPLRPANATIAASRACCQQHRLPGFVASNHVFDNGRKLRLFSAIDNVRLIFADHRHVGWDLDHAEAVNLLELGFLGLRGTGHARELVVHAEVVLQRNRGERLVFVLDLDAFFGFERLV